MRHQSLASISFHMTCGAALLWLTCGCAHYEYDIVRPPDLAQHVGTKSWTIVPVDPLRYRMISTDDHLVIQIENPTNNSITLVGGQSVAVDPAGQSHSLRTRTIAGNSYIKLVLPPTLPQAVPTGPRIGIGFGGVFGSARGFHRGYGYGFYEPLWYDEPRYYSVVIDNEDSYWRWEGGGTARLLLAFQHGVNESVTFAHAFVFGRKKV